MPIDGTAGGAMRTRLLLLTSKYPFAHGEEFIESEIPYLADAMDEILVIPCSFFPDWAEAARHPRLLPSNAHVPMDLATRVQWELATPRVARTLRVLGDAETRGDLVSEAAVAAGLGSTALARLLHMLSTGRIVRSALASLGRRSDTGTVLYSYWLTASAWAAGRAADALGAAAVARVHGGDLYPERHSPAYLPLQSAVIGRLDRVFAVSEHGLDDLRGRFPQHAERLHLRRLGVPRAPTQSRAGQASTLQLLSCSSLVGVKRVRLLVEALARCSASVAWTHLGGGPLLEDLSARCRRLPGNVTWRLEGQVTRDEVMRYYAQEAVDLFVNVSESEGLPVAIMEAMSFGVPVLAPDVGGISELVSRRTGALLPADPSPAQVATAIDAHAAVSEETRWDMRKAALATWAELVDAERQYSRFAGELRELAVRTMRTS